MLYHIFFHGLVVFVNFLVKESHSLRLVQVRVPSPVAKDSTAILECEYDLEGDKLYAIKWYKNGKEFYRCYGSKARDDDRFVVFPQRGIYIDKSSSTCNTVNLIAVTSESSGNYECEISGEAPYFQTLSQSSDMEVVVLPEDGPIIVGGRSKYRIGDVADLNCSVSRSSPEAKLTWYINDLAAPHHYLIGPYNWVTQEDTVSVLIGLHFEIKPHHFKNGELKIKCVASMSNYYEQSDEHKIHEAFIFDSAETTTDASIVEESTSNYTLSSSNRMKNSVLTFCIECCVLNVILNVLDLA